MAKPIVVLGDDNAFSIIGSCKRAAKDAGWPKEEINKVVDEMMSGDYDHLLQIAMDKFDVQCEETDEDGNCTDCEGCDCCEDEDCEESLDICEDCGMPYEECECGMDDDSEVS